MKAEETNDGGENPPSRPKNFTKERILAWQLQRWPRAREKASDEGDQLRSRESTDGRGQ